MARRMCWIGVAGAAAALTFPAAASADSLVYIQADNVWIANADGSSPYQVTLDGTAAYPYESPSEADDGTIVAVRASATSRRQLFHLRQNGELVSPPIDTPAPGTGAIDARVSPDGRLVAYWFATTVNDPLCPFCADVANRALISAVDRFTSPDAIGTPHTGGWPSWLGNDTIVITSGSAEVWYYRLGMPEAATWFADFEAGGGVPIPTLLDAEVSRAGDRLAVVRGDNQETVALYALNGPPPVLPSPFIGNCLLQGPTGRFHDPTWSSDGQLLAVADDTGVSVVPVPTLAGCGTPRLAIPGASSPDFGPADVNPGPRGGDGGGTDTVAPGTRFTAHPKARNRLRRPTFAFRATEAGATFRCRLDRRAWSACRSPYRPVVGFGRHVLRVRAVDRAGNVDATPAVFSWKRLRPLLR